MIITRRVFTAVLSLTEMLQDKDPLIVSATCIALSNCGDAGEPALKALMDLKESNVADKNSKAHADAAIKQIQATHDADLAIANARIAVQAAGGTASQLLQIFEGLARQQELLMLLERRMKYDRLGINDALLQFETELNRKLLPEPERALPTLDQIAGDARFVEIGRQRARNLAERIRHQS